MNKNLTIKDLRNIENMLHNYKSLLITNEVEGVERVLDRQFNYSDIMDYLSYAIPNIDEYLDEPNDETTILITYK